MGKFGPKKSKLSVLTENWHTWYLGSADSESGVGFLKFRHLKIHFWANLGRKNQSCLFFLKIGTHGILMMLILIPTLVFWISNPNSIFGTIWTKKVKVVQFGWKLAHRKSRRCWSLFWHSFSQFPTLNHFLDKFCIEKFKVVHFNSKLTQMVYQGCWFLFRQYLFELLTLNPFLGKFVLKKWKLFVLPENWHTPTY